MAPLGSVGCSTRLILQSKVSLLVLWGADMTFAVPPDRFSSCTQIKKDKALMSSFQDGLSYSTFRTITNLFLRAVDTRGESEVKAQGFKAALAIDAIAKLTAIDNHPMNRMLGFGTKYLKEYFSPWVQQNGGWVSSTH